MRPVTVSIDNNRTLQVHTEGDFLHVLSGVASGVTIYDNDGVFELAAVTNYNVSGKRFRQLNIVNTSGATVTLVLMIGNGTTFDAGGGGYRNVNVSTGHSYGATTVGTTAVTVGGTAGQIRLTVESAVANTQNITVGTVAGTGLTLYPGDTRSFDTSAALSFIAGGAGQTLNWHLEVA